MCVCLPTSPGKCSCTRGATRTVALTPARSRILGNNARQNGGHTKAPRSPAPAIFHRLRQTTCSFAASEISCFHSYSKSIVSTINVSCAYLLSVIIYSVYNVHVTLSKCNILLRVNFRSIRRQHLHFNKIK